MKDYLFAVSAVAVSTALSFAIFPHFAPINLSMIYLLGTLAVAARGHRGPAALAALLGVLCFDFFFIPPRFSFSVTDVEYLFTFAVMFLTAMVISHLTTRLHKEAESARQGEARTAMMHAFTQQLAEARNQTDVLNTAMGYLTETFNCIVTIFVPDHNGKLISKTNLDEQKVSEKQQGIAQWVYDSRKPAGVDTESLPTEDSLYLPLIGTKDVAGVVRILSRNADGKLTVDQRLLLESFARQIALALDVDKFQESAKKAEVEAESERLRSSLLSSVSHDLRTPLTAIVGSASALINKEELRRSPRGLELLQTIQSEGERMAHLVQNLLETTRLESGGLKVKKELFPLEEVIGIALGRLEKTLESRKVSIKVPPDLSPAPMDGILIEQVLINLLENAARHTPANSSIEVTVRLETDQILVSIADRGTGIKENDLERVFDKFYHGKSSPGAGLGLAICKAIIEAHGGKIWAENAASGGAVFKFTLPISQ